MFKHTDMGAAMRRLAERKIDEAMRAGKFENLEGAGKPLDLEPMPAEENARMTWWAIRLLRRNDVILDEVKYRKSFAALTRLARTAATECELREWVAEANVVVRKLNTMGTNALPGDVVPLDVEAEVRSWRERRS